MPKTIFRSDRRPVASATGSSRVTRPGFSAADLSDDDRRQLLSRALDNAEGPYSYCWIRDVYGDFFTYEDWDDDATYRRSYEIDDALNVSLGEPEEVIARTVYEPVKMAAFAIPVTHLSNDRFNVYPNSLLFEIRGRQENFRDKGITICEDDLADIVRSFDGASMGLEHTDTVLGDNCGYVTDVRLQGARQIYGTVAIPKGLDELIPAGPRKVSVEIEKDAGGKWTMPKVDLVLNPRIERAALMGIKTFAGKRHSDTDAADIQAIHDLAQRQGASCSGEMNDRGSHQPNAQLNASRPRQMSGRENKPMAKSGWEKFKAFINGEGEDEEEIEDEPTQTTPRSARPAVRESAEIAELRKFREDTLKAKRTSVEAVAVRCFGQNAPALEAAKKTIEALGDVTALDNLAAQYEAMIPAHLKGDGKRQTQATGFGARPAAPASPTSNGAGGANGMDDEPAAEFNMGDAMTSAARKLAGKDAK